MKPIGYQWLIHNYGLCVVPFWTEFYELEKGGQRTEVADGVTKVMLRPGNSLKEHWSDHLEFALKREGLHLEAIKKLVRELPAEEVVAYIESKPTGKYARICWFLYEEFTGAVLPLADLEMGNYVPLLPVDRYLTGASRKIRRQRIDNNLLGDVDFSPIVRLGDSNLGQRSDDLKGKCQQMVDSVPEEIYERAIRYLYAKESKSSHEIERETPNEERGRRFIALLEQAWEQDFLQKDKLVEVQNTIVDERFQDRGCRDETGEQIYVGESYGLGGERVHYIGPRPEDTSELMDSFLGISGIMASHRGIPDLVAVALIAYLFNYIHPFSDGNGRIHRFLMHHVLAKREFGRRGIILPISAAILNRPMDYERSLESFSKPLLKVIDYTLDSRSRMTVIGETADHYRYIDCTDLVSIFMDLAEEAIEKEMPAEVAFLQGHDRCRAAMRGVVDLPNRNAELLIKFCLQNEGVLSKNKRKLSEFSMLTEDELDALQRIVQDSLGIGR